MLQSTQELADLLPLGLREGLISYINEVNVMIDSVVDVPQTSTIENARPRIELIFFLKYLYEHLTEGDSHLRELFSVFQHVGVPGFRVEGTVYDYENRQENVAQRFIEQSDELRNSFDDLIERLGLSEDISRNLSVDSIIGMIFEDSGH